MSSTTVHSNNNQNKGILSIIAGSTFITTEKTLEVPPKSNVHEVISTYVEEQGNVEILVHNSNLKENGTLETPEGRVTLKNPEAYKNILANKAKREKLQGKYISELEQETR